MASEIDVVNMALSRIGANTISSVDDPTNEARLAKLELDQSKSSLLRQANWNFATKWQVMYVTADVVVFPDFKYIFSLPVDYIRVQAMKYPTSTVASGELRSIDRWNITGRYLGTDVESPLMRYTNNAGIGFWDDMAIEALVWRMAANLSSTLSRSETTRAYAAQQFMMAYQLAQNVDGKEKVLDRVTTDGRLLSARRGGSSVW
tara:strand:- start:9382 stop:9993 length:612 start_codon:yes stop_codon:yes gene_type:complete